MVRIVDVNGGFRTRSWIAIVVAVLWVATAGADPVESVPWDQEAVTAIAAELAQSVSGVDDAFRKEPGNAMPTGDRAARLQAQQDLRRLRQKARQLARQLKAGDGREQTLNSFLNLQQIAHSAGESGKRAALTQPTLDAVAKARAQLTKLAPYYGETWTPVMTPH